MTNPIDDIDSKIREILVWNTIQYTGKSLTNDRALKAIKNLLLEAQLQLLRDIKNSEGYGKMPIGMRDLLSDFSQTINELKQKGE